MKPLRLLLPLAVLGLVWLLWPGAAEAPAPLGVGDPAADGAPPDPLAADAPDGPGLARTAPEGAGGEGAPRRYDCTICASGTRGEARVGIPIRILDPRAGGRATILLTDESGRVHVPDVPLDGSLRVEMLRGCGPGPLDAQPVVARTRLEEPTQYLLFPDGLPIHVEVVDAESGRPVGGAGWHLTRPTPLRSVREDTRLHMLPGESGRVGIVVDAATIPEHVSWESSEAWVRVSRYAAALRVVHPLRREARVHVRAVEHDGAPTPLDRMHVEGFHVAGRYSAARPRTTPDRDGRLLHGVPFYRDQPLRVLVTRAPGTAEPTVEEEEFEFLVLEGGEEIFGRPTETSASGRPGGVHSDAAVGEGRLPHEPEYLCLVVATFPEDDAATVDWGVDGQGVIEDHAVTDRDAPRATGVVLATVRRADGTPLPGASVSCNGESRRTDVTGRVRFPSAPVGPCRLILEELGVVRTEARAEVREGQVTAVELREAPGATLRVRVVAEDGETVPFAAVRHDVGDWVDLVDGVQRLDPFTDAKGRRTLPRVPAGKRTVRAWWGGLYGKTQVEAKDGATHEVVVTVKPVKE